MSQPIDPFFVNPAYPIDAAAERSLIASLIDRPALLSDVVLHLGNSEAMGNEAYRLILEAIRSLDEAQLPVKLSSIIQHLQRSGGLKILTYGGIDLMAIQKEATHTDPIETALYIRSLWVKRKAVDGAGEILNAVKWETVEQLTDRVNGFAEKLAGDMTLSRERSHSDYVGEMLQNLNRAKSSVKSGGTSGVPTGSAKLNKHIGGWQNTDMILIAARPGAGKTAVGTHCAKSAAEVNVPVAYLSLEMAAWSLVNRVISEGTGIEYGKVKKGFTTDEEDQAIHREAGRVEQLPIHWYDDAERDINDLSYMLVNWKKKYGIGLIVIDYVQLLEDRTVKSGDETAVNASVSKKIKKLQRRLNIPIIALAQLNRGVEARAGDKRGKMSDTKNSGQYEQDASVVITLYRPDYYAEEAAKEKGKETNKFVAPELTHVLEAIIAKSRDGYTGTVLLHAIMATNQIYDNPPHQPKTPVPAQPIKHQQNFPADANTSFP